MNRLWLKIVACVVVVLLAAIAVYVFRPAEQTQIVESKDIEQAHKPAENKLATEAKPLRGKLQRLFPERSAAPARFRPSKAADYRRLSPFAREFFCQPSFGNIRILHTCSL